MTKVPEQWTLVQHSGYGYAGKPGFKQGLEPRSVTRKVQADLVRREGGLLFDNYMEANEMAHNLQYPEGYDGMYPMFRGTFSTHVIDDLKIAIPLREIVA